MRSYNQNDQLYKSFILVGGYKKKNKKNILKIRQQSQL